MRSQEDCERWRERNNLSQSEAALKLQISKRTLQEWEQDRATPRGFARAAIEKDHACLACPHTSLFGCGRPALVAVPF